MRSNAVEPIPVCRLKSVTFCNITKLIPFSNSLIVPIHLIIKLHHIIFIRIAKVASLSPLIAVFPGVSATDSLVFYIQERIGVLSWRQKYHITHDKLHK
jgi:hypothetical protein